MNTSEFVMIPIDQLEMAEFNANSMDDEQLNSLIETIEENGFDEPLQVVKIEDTDPNEPARYRVIGGNHRLMACRSLNYKELPCSIKDWDLPRQKLEIVKRNILRGDLDRKKFNSLVNDIEEDGKLALDQISKGMGFKDSEFLKVYKQKKEKEEEIVGSSVVNNVTGGIKVVEDDLAFIINKIFADSGDTVKNGYMFFMYRGKMHYLSIMDKDVSEKLDQACNYLKNDEKNINDYLRKVFDIAEVKKKR